MNQCAIFARRQGGMKCVSCVLFHNYVNSLRPLSVRTRFLSWCNALCYAEVKWGGHGGIFKSLWIKASKEQIPHGWHTS